MIENERPFDRFRSKGETLQRMSGMLKKSLIEPLYIFAESDWGQNTVEITDSIKINLMVKQL